MHLLQSSQCNCQQIAGTLLFVTLQKTSCHRSVAHSENLFKKLNLGKVMLSRGGRGNAIIYKDFPEILPMPNLFLQ